jgi:hypothetical protein
MSLIFISGSVMHCERATKLHRRNFNRNIKSSQYTASLKFIFRHAQILFNFSPVTQVTRRDSKRLLKNNKVKVTCSKGTCTFCVSTCVETLQRKGSISPLQLSSSVIAISVRIVFLGLHMENSTVRLCFLLHKLNGLFVNFINFVACLEFCKPLSIVTDHK